MKQLTVSPRQPGHGIRKNTFLGLVLSGIGTLYPMLVFLYVARILHPAGIGEVQFASSYVAYFSLFTGLGMSIYGHRAVAERRFSPEKLSRLTAELMILRLFSGILAWGLFFLSTLILRQRTDDNGMILMIYSAGILMAIPECSWLYRGMEDYSPMVWISAGARIFGIAAILLLVHSPSDIHTYAWISVLVPFMASLGELFLAEKKWHLGIVRECRKILSSEMLFMACLKHLRPLALFLLMSCAVTIYGHTDVVMLNLMTGDQHMVGLYTCAAKLKGLLPMLTGALWAAALPKSADLWQKQDIPAFRELAGKSFHVVTVITIPLALYFCLFAEPWIHIIGGKEYLDAAQTMRFLLPAVIAIGYSNIIGGQMLIPMGQERKLFYAELIGAVSNIALNALLIPLWSASGAAIATVLSEILVTVVAAISVRKQVKIRVLQPAHLCRSLFGCLIAGLVSFGVTTLISAKSAFHTYSASKVSVIAIALLSLIVFGGLFTLIMLIFRDALYKDLLSSARKVYRKIIPASIRIPLGKITRGFRVIRYRLEEKAFPQKCKYYCPCCETRLMTFVSEDYLDDPAYYNPDRYVHMNGNVICPVCGALPRHRILALWCEEHIDLLRSAGCQISSPTVSNLESSLSPESNGKTSSPSTPDCIAGSPSASNDKNSLPSASDCGISSSSESNCKSSLPSTSGILYFAPEDCMMRWMKRHQIACTTADLYQKADLKIDIQNTGLPDQSLDIIICNHVLEHVEDFRKALKELYRILKPGGHLICSFPMDPHIEIVDEADPSGTLTPEARLQRFGQADHLRVFGLKADILLEEAGFTVETISGETCPSEILPVIGPADYDINCLFNCTRPTVMLSHRCVLP